jgi:tetratricopeptide (TPR) repeat protein
MSLRLTMPYFRSAFAACALVALLYPSPASADTPAEHAGPNGAKVGELFDQAQAAFAKGDKQAAYKAYKEAWALQKSYDIAGNLGNVELKLGMYSEAAEHLDYALANFPPTGEPAAQQLLTKKLDEARKELGRVRVLVNVAGARVFVDGRLVGTSPLAEAVYVSPTGCTIEAKLEGYVDARGAASPSKGSEKEVKLSLAPDHQGPNTAIVVTGSALTAVSLAMAIGFTAAANAKSADANVDLKALQATGILCPNVAISTQCTELRGKLAGLTSLHNVAEGAFIGAGVFLLATVAYAALPIGRGSPGKASGSVRIVPVVAGSQSGLLVSGSF